MTDPFSDHSIPDQELVSRILAGEQRLFECIIRRYNQRLYRMGMAVLGRDEEVEDAMQTVYINAYEHLDRFEYRSSLATWLTRIMLNECYTQKRKNKQVIIQTEQPENLSTMKTPANELMNKELKAVLEQAIDQLPEKYRLVFVLRELEGMSVRDAAHVLSIGEPNIKVRLNRAKTMLRDSLGGYMKNQVYGFHLSRCDRMVAAVMEQIGGNRTTH